MAGIILGTGQSMSQPRDKVPLPSVSLDSNGNDLLRASDDWPCFCALFQHGKLEQCCVQIVDRCRRRQSRWGGETQHTRQVRGSKIAQNAKRGKHALKHKTLGRQRKSALFRPPTLGMNVIRPNVSIVFPLKRGTCTVVPKSVHYSVRLRFFESIFLHAYPNITITTSFDHSRSTKTKGNYRSTEEQARDISVQTEARKTVKSRSFFSVRVWASGIHETTGNRGLPLETTHSKVALHHRLRAFHAHSNPRPMYEAPHGCR